MSTTDMVLLASGCLLIMATSIVYLAALVEGHRPPLKGRLDALIQAVAAKKKGALPVTESEAEFIRMVDEGEAAALRDLEAMDPEKLRAAIREFRTPAFIPWSLEPPSPQIEIEKAPAGELPAVGSFWG